jgi:hypothetical protein
MTDSNEIEQAILETKCPKCGKAQSMIIAIDEFPEIFCKRCKHTYNRRDDPTAELGARVVDRSDVFDYIR